MSKTNEMRPIQLTREAPKNFDEVEGVGFSYYNFTSDNDRKFPYESQEYNAQLFNNKVCAAIMDNPVQIPPSNICTHPSVVSEVCFCRCLTVCSIYCLLSTFELN